MIIPDKVSRKNCVKHDSAFLKLTNISDVNVIGPFVYFCDELYCKTRSLNGTFHYKDKKYMRPSYIENTLAR